MMSEQSQKVRERGRPRQFDVNAALDLAILVFREKGFYNASISDLSKGMQLASGSIYKAFHDKRNLFLQAFERYTSLRIKSLRQRLAQQPDGRSGIAELLRFYLESASDTEGRRGCLVVGSTIELQLFDAGISERVHVALQRNQLTIQHLIEKGQNDGSVNPQHDANALSNVLVCQVLGMRVSGKIKDIDAGELMVATVLRMLD